MRQTLHDEKYFSSFLFFLWFQYNKDHIMNDFLPAPKTVRLFLAEVNTGSVFVANMTSYSIIPYSFDENEPRQILNIQKHSNVIKSIYIYA